MFRTDESQVRDPCLCALGQLSSAVPVSTALQSLVAGAMERFFLAAHLRLRPLRFPCSCLLQTEAHQLTCMAVVRESCRDCISSQALSASVASHNAVPSELGKLPAKIHLDALHNLSNARELAAHTD